MHLSFALPGQLQKKPAKPMTLAGFFCLWRIEIRLICKGKLSWLRGQDLNLRPSGYEPVLGATDHGSLWHPWRCPHTLALKAILLQPSPPLH